MGWTIVGERNVASNSPGSDDWVEYLAIRPCGNAFEMTICGYEVLGEPPSSWFNEDGNPLPAYSTKNGSLLFPDELYGTKISAYDGVNFLGDLVQDPDFELVVILDNAESISKGSVKLNWTEPGALLDISTTIFSLSV
jgi:hypothetical protein